MADQTRTPGSRSWIWILIYGGLFLLASASRWRARTQTLRLGASVAGALVAVVGVVLI